VTYNERKTEQQQQQLLPKLIFGPAAKQVLLPSTGESVDERLGSGLAVSVLSHTD
jgi:hypothetical protein